MWEKKLEVYGIDIKLEQYWENNIYDPDEIFNKRENLDEKISEREMMFQCGLNPFLSNTSYVNDVVTRDMFLKPVNTTCGERSKNKDFDGQ